MGDNSIDRGNRKSKHMVPGSRLLLPVERGKGGKHIFITIYIYHSVNKDRAILHSTLRQFPRPRIHVANASTGSNLFKYYTKIITKPYKTLNVRNTSAPILCQYQIALGLGHRKQIILFTMNPVHTYVASKRIELESPSCSGFEENLKSFKT